MKRYRRIKTIINKALDTADVCGVEFNIIVYDPKLHRLKEHFTSNNVKLSTVHLLSKPLANSTKSRKKLRTLKFQSIDARLRNFQYDSLPETKLPLFKLIEESLPTT